MYNSQRFALLTRPGRGVGPQVSKVEQNSSDDHQMSVAGVGGGGRCLGSMSRMRREDKREGRGWKGVPYRVTYPMMHILYLPSPTSLNRMTDTCESITFQQLRLRTVTILPALVTSGLVYNIVYHLNTALS